MARRARDAQLAMTVAAHHDSMENAVSDSRKLALTKVVQSLREQAQMIDDDSVYGQGGDPDTMRAAADMLESAGAICPTDAEIEAIVKHSFRLTDGAYAIGATQFRKGAKWSREVRELRDRQKQRGE